MPSKSQSKVSDQQELCNVDEDDLKKSPTESNKKTTLKTIKLGWKERYPPDDMKYHQVKMPTAEIIHFDLDKSIDYSPQQMTKLLQKKFLSTKRNATHRKKFNHSLVTFGDFNGHEVGQHSRTTKETNVHFGHIAHRIFVITLVG